MKPPEVKVCCTLWCRMVLWAVACIMAFILHIGSETLPYNGSSGSLGWEMGKTEVSVFTRIMKLLFQLLTRKRLASPTSWPYSAHWFWRACVLTLMSPHVIYQEFRALAPWADASQLEIPYGISPASLDILKYLATGFTGAIYESPL